MAETSKPDNFSPAIDPEIRHPLGKLRGFIRRYVTIDGLLTLALFAAVWFWVGLIYDYGVFRLFAFDWVQETPVGLRASILGVVVVTLIALLITRVIRRLFGEFSARNLAMLIERKFPKELGDRLITAVDLADVEKQATYGYSAPMIRRTIGEARERVEALPVQRVMNWRRLRLRFGLAFVATVGLALVAAGVMLGGFSMEPKVAYRDAGDVATIWVERNVLLRNTPWPRHAYLEVADFPDSEKRVGQDNASVRLKVQAFEWVWSDPSADGGVRPMTYADLSGVFPPSEIPALPIAQLQQSRLQAEEAGILFGSLSAFRKPKLPPELAGVPADPAAWRIDRLQRVLIDFEGNDNASVKVLIGDAKFDELKALLARLDERSRDASVSRTMRHLEVPRKVKLRYTGQKTRVDMELRADGDNEFIGTIADLKESVDFVCKGDDFYTPKKRLTLVPAPAFSELARDEYRPAYLYYRPALDETASAGPLFADAMKLKGLKQPFLNQGVSLSGDKSRFEIPMGTELVITGTSTKPLETATVVPRAGKFPGLATGESKPLEMELSDDGMNVRFPFDSAAKRKIESLTEFDIVMKDRDGVSSKRLIQIQPEEDAAPEVEVVVETMRKVGNYYLCTPKALVPFAKESKVRDRNGINKIEYVFTTRPIESATESSARMGVIMGLWLDTPAIPTIGNFVSRAATYSRYAPVMASDLRESEQAAALLQSFVSTFNADSLGRLPTKQNLEEAIKSQLPAEYASGLITYMDFKLPGEPGFDLERVLPELLEKNELALQRHYLLTLNVRATDSNVETGPKTGENKETLVFRVISEDELLLEIAREQQDLALKMDEAIRRVEESQRKLGEMASRLPSFAASNDFTGAQTLAQTVTENVLKANDLVLEISTDYNRIQREYTANRLPERRQEQLSSSIVRPLDSVLRNEFPIAQAAHNAVSVPLNASASPNAGLIDADSAALAALLGRLKAVRNDMGLVVGINELVAKMNAIIAAQQVLGAGMKGVIADMTRKAFAPSLRAVPVSIAAGAKAKVDVQILWKDAPKDEYSWTLKYPDGSGLTGPTEIKPTDEPDSVPVEITAGSQKGDFEVIITPTWGDPLKLKVSVK